jgi:hypothetical protein
VYSSQNILAVFTSLSIRALSSDVSTRKKDLASDVDIGSLAGAVINFNPAIILYLYFNALI